MPVLCCASLQERLERIQSEQSRLKKESAKRQTELDSEAKAHAERRRTLEADEEATERQKSEGRVEEEQILERIGRMSLPNSVKQRLQMHYVSFSSIYTTSPVAAAAVEGEGEAAGEDGDALPPAVDTDVEGVAAADVVEEHQETLSL